jgi:hypothetical protein
MGYFFHDGVLTVVLSIVVMPIVVMVKKII